MIDGRPYGGREKRQRSNSGVGKGVKAVLAIGSKGAGSIIQTPPGGIRAGRPQPVRQAGESPSAPSVWCALAEGFMWAERPGPAVRDSLSDLPTAWTHPRVWCPGKFARGGPAQGPPIHHGARGMGVYVRRVVLCAGLIPAGRKSLKGVHTDGF